MFATKVSKVTSTNEDCHVILTYSYFSSPGDDCSVEESASHWSVVNYTSSLPLSSLARTGHSAVVWEDSMIVYGGYRFPEEGYSYGDTTGDTSSGGWGSGAGSDDVLRYGFDSGMWEVLYTSGAVYSQGQVGVVGVEGSAEGNEVLRKPASRYGHSAVVYNVSGWVCVDCLFP